MYIYTYVYIYIYIYKQTIMSKRDGRAAAQNEAEYEKIPQHQLHNNMCIYKYVCIYIYIYI